MDVERAIQYLLDMQAKFEAGLQAEAEARRAEAEAEAEARRESARQHEERMQGHEAWLRQHENRIDALTELVNGVARLQSENAKAIRHLIAAVDRLVSRNGHPES